MSFRSVFTRTSTANKRASLDFSKIISHLPRLRKYPQQVEIFYRLPGRQRVMSEVYASIDEVYPCNWILAHILHELIS